MDSIPGDKWVADYARWVYVHEAKLGDVGRRVVSNGSRGQPGNAAPGAATTSSGFWNVVSLGTSASSSVIAPKPLLLKLNPHYLYYLLIRFEALALSVGPLDVKIPAAAQPTTSFSWVSAQAGKDKSDTMSLSSIRTGLSAVSTSLSSASSWFTSTPVRQDPNRDIKYLYSSFTKIPNLYLGPIPARKLVQDFEDSPGQSSVPLDVFKNLQLLELEDVDPRTLIGWDRLSIQLRSLTCKRSSVEDLSHLLIDLVVNDGRRRRGEKVARKNPVATDGDSLGAPDMPTHAWHFLRYLNLSSNNLTFVPSEPLVQLSSLTNLDLSSNLLNLVPPALNQLPALTSLNISDNLIDSVLGIYDTIKSIRVLNISKNRLESLCGLERLYTLERIDLRTNSIYEAGEIGRLATLPKIKEVWVRENPLVEELVDYRVECYVEFAREGRTVVLDGEAPGFFEKQRIAERAPQPASAEPSASDTSQHTSKLKGETEQEAQVADRVITLVKNVRHKGAGSSFARSNPSVTAQSIANSSNKAGSKIRPSKSDKDNRTTTDNGTKKRVQRLVELETSPQKTSTDSRIVDSASAKPLKSLDEAPPELSESDFIKQAARSGDNAGALESPDPKRAQAASLQQTPMSHEKLTWSRKAGAAAAALTAQTTTGALDAPTDASELARASALQTRDVAESLPEPTQPSSNLASDGANASSTRSEALRKKIEALKSEVGDDWLRLLSRGDATHLSQEDVDAAKTSDAGSVVRSSDASHSTIQVSSSKRTRGNRRDAPIT